MACDSNQGKKVNTELKINGGKIELNNFVENFISQTVIGMVTSLRGVSNIETIDLKILKRQKALKHNKNVIYSPKASIRF